VIKIILQTELKSKLKVCSPLPNPIWLNAALYANGKRY